MLIPSKKENIGRMSISLDTPVPKEENQYATEKEHLINSSRDGWSLHYNINLPMCIRISPVKTLNALCIVASQKQATSNPNEISLSDQEIFSPLHLLQSSFCCHILIHTTWFALFDTPSVGTAKEYLVFYIPPDLMYHPSEKEQQ